MVIRAIFLYPNKEVKLLNKDERELLLFAAKFGSGIGNALEDGKLSPSDAFKFKDALLAIFPAIQDVQNVKATNFRTTENREEAIGILVNEFDLEDDKVEKKVEKVINFIDSFLDLAFNWNE